MLVQGLSPRLKDHLVTVVIQTIEVHVTDADVLFRGDSDSSSRDIVVKVSQGLYRCNIGIPCQIAARATEAFDHSDSVEQSEIIEMSGITSFRQFILGKVFE